MFYLYFILPPVVIVISLAIIIFLISKRSLEIAKEIENGEDGKIESRISMEFKSRWLHFLEKIAHIFKVLSLKTHNWTEKRLTFIKNRKNEIESDLDKKDFEENGLGGLVESKDEILGELVESEPVVKEVVNSMDAVRNNSTEKKGGIFNRGRGIKKEELDIRDAREERIMISKEATYPEENKEELESLLVERIASDPRDIEAYERLGDYYVSQGNKVDAESCYKQVLKLNPQSLSVRNKLSRFKRKRF
ncbi:MAG: tetratricopeptide repeat protein [Parcubacteria group bacterium]|jgi:tetratricopeptide (TPR) repeat protein